MKPMIEYTEGEISRIMKELGAFWAFSQSQYDEQRQPDVRYTSTLGGGLICPVDNIKQLVNGLNAAVENGMKADVAENGIEAIVLREIHNHECYYTGDPQAAIDKLSHYPVTKEFIQEVFDKNWPNEH